MSPDRPTFRTVIHEMGAAVPSMLFCAGAQLLPGKEGVTFRDVWAACMILALLLWHYAYVHASLQYTDHVRRLAAAVAELEQQARRRARQVLIVTLYWAYETKSETLMESVRGTIRALAATPEDADWFVANAPKTGNERVAEAFVEFGTLRPAVHTAGPATETRH
jgi:hypothetical protein